VPHIFEDLLDIHALKKFPENEAAVH